jgi:hypothetical protein
VLLVRALAVAISGPGVYLLDAVLRLAPPEPVTLIGGRQPSEELQVTVRPGRQLAKVSFSQPNASGRPPR